MAKIQKSIIDRRGSAHSREISKIPAEIEKLLGKPPVLANENPKLYKRLLLHTAKSKGIAETDLIGWILANDSVHHFWEMRRTRTVCTEVINTGVDIVHRGACKDTTEEQERRVARKWLGKSDKATCMAFLQQLDSYERVTRLHASAEVRRAATYREIERHSESMASRRRKTSDDIIDGDFTEYHPASTTIHPAVAGKSPSSRTPSFSHLPIIRRMTSSVTRLSRKAHQALHWLGTIFMSRWVLDIDTVKYFASSKPASAAPGQATKSTNPDPGHAAAASGQATKSTNPDPGHAAAASGQATKSANPDPSHAAAASGQATKSTNPDPGHAAAASGPATKSANPDSGKPAAAASAPIATPAG